MELVSLLALGALNGFVWGLILALIALGLTLVFGLLDIINIAHGELFMLGAVFGWYIIQYTDSFWLALLGAPVLAGILGLLIERGVLRPLENQPIITILFVGWNPPGARHFWGGPGDDLHDNLAWVFRELGWSRAPNFFAEFAARCCFLVHAVKCWRDPSWPTEDATQRCAPLLADDIARLQPRIICLLGRRPHLAAVSPAGPGTTQPVIRGLPRVSTMFRYGRGWCGVVDGTKVIITTFANRRWNGAEAMENRACVADALRRWA